MPSFEIPGGPSRLEFMGQSVDGKPVKTATITYTVNNRTQQELTARLKVSPVGDAKAEWFQIQGERERKFAAAETQTITVMAKKPANPSSPNSAQRGAEYNFRLVVMNVEDPGNDYAESAVCTLVEQIPITTTRCPYCPYIALAAALLLTVVSSTAYLISGPEPKPPPQIEKIPPIAIPPPAVTVSPTAPIKWAPKRPEGDAEGAKSACFTDKDELYGEEDCTPYLVQQGPPRRYACWPNDNRNNSKAIELCMRAFGNTYEAANAERDRRAMCPQIASEHITDVFSLDRTQLNAKWIYPDRDGYCIRVAKQEMCLEARNRIGRTRNSASQSALDYFDQILTPRYCS